MTAELMGQSKTLKCTVTDMSDAWDTVLFEWVIDTWKVAINCNYSCSRLVIKPIRIGFIGKTNFSCAECELTTQKNKCSD